MPVKWNALGKRIKIQRKRKRLSQNVLSEKIDKTPTFLSYIENGNKTMSMDTFVDIVNALETTPNELLKDSVDLHGEDIALTLADDIGGCSEEERKLLVEVIQAVREIYSRNEREKGSR